MIKKSEWYVSDYWCPNGCGKRVSGILVGRTSIYQCSVCKRKFKKEELSKTNNNGRLFGRNK